MADVCPTCLRPIATAELQPGACSKSFGPEQWRRNECFNTGIAARDAVIAKNAATMRAQDELLLRARDVLTSTAAKLDAALEQLNRERDSSCQRREVVSRSSGAGSGGFTQ